MMPKPCLARTLAFVAALAAGLGAAEAMGAVPAADSIAVAQVPYIFDIAVDRSDPAHLFLATRSGLFRLAPDGSAMRVSVGENPIWNVVSHPVAANVLYAVGISVRGGRVGPMVSRDSGRTWRRLAGAETKPLNVRRIGASESDPARIYGVGDDLWASRDGGETWNREASLDDWAIDFAASSFRPETIYVATFSGLDVSTDGGRTWKPAWPGLCSQPVTAVAASADGLVYAYSLCNGLLRTDEGTEDWVVVNDDFGGCIIQHIAVDPMDGDKLYAVVRCNKVLASADGGRTWRVFGSKEATVPSCPTNPYGRPEPDRLGAVLDAAEIGYVDGRRVLPPPRTAPPKRGA